MFTGQVWGDYMKIKEIHMKIIAIGLLPIFLVLASTIAKHLPAKSLLLAGYSDHRSCGIIHRNVNAEEGSKGT